LKNKENREQENGAVGNAGGREVAPSEGSYDVGAGLVEDISEGYDGQYCHCHQVEDKALPYVRALKTSYKANMNLMN